MREPRTGHDRQAVVGARSVPRQRWGGAGPRAGWWRSARPLRGVAFTLCVPLLIAACAGLPGAASTYTSARATLGNLSVTATTSGTLRAAEYDLNFAGTATVHELDVAVGQQVTRGQVLARLDAPALQVALTAARANTAASAAATADAANALAVTESATSAEVQAARAVETDTIQNQCPRAINRGACVSGAQAAYNATVARTQQQLATAQSQLSIARAQLAAAQSAEQAARSNLSQTTITAPASGTVAAINGAVGSLVGTAIGNGSIGGGSAFIQLIDLSQMQIAASASQVQITTIRAGDSARFSVPAYPGRIFRGTIGAVSPFGQAGSGGTATYPMVVSVDARSLGDASLFPGMAAAIVVTTAQRFGVLLVPTSAIQFAQQAADPRRGILTQAQITTALEDARRQLAALQVAAIDITLDRPTPSFLLERRHDRWVVRPVVLGLTNGSVYEVLAGLTDGEQVVTGVAASSVPII